MTIQEINPIPLTAVVTVTANGGYTVNCNYGTTNVDEVDDSFQTVPSTLTVNITSTTVPAGCHLTASGDGTWTNNSPSSLTGTFTGKSGYSFTVNVLNGTRVLASHDPRLIIRKIGVDPT